MTVKLVSTTNLHKLDTATEEQMKAVSKDTELEGKEMREQFISTSVELPEQQSN